MQALVSIGSNIEPEQHIRGALSALRSAYGAVLCSSAYRSPAVGFEGPHFLNLVVLFETAEPPLSLAEQLRTIESRLGRVRTGPKFSSRPIDLDLILYGNHVLHEPPLRLPSPDITRYAFVLWPLAELVPNLVHPEWGRTFAELREELDVEPRELSVFPFEGALSDGAPDSQGVRLRPPSTAKT